MNWPPLAPKTTEVIADVLRAAAQQRPSNLFEFVAQSLQDRSGLDPAEFAQFFGESRRKPRTYVLEDRCPAGQDPLSWVPMRFSDVTLQSRAQELTSEVLAALPVEDTKAFLDKLCLAFPEAMYIRRQPSDPIVSLEPGSLAPLEVYFFQHAQATCIACSGCKSPPLDNECMELAFVCEALVEDTRRLIEHHAADCTLVEMFFVLFLLRTLGNSEAFRRRYGNGLDSPEKAILFAMEHETEALPSFRRLPKESRAVVRAAFESFVPLELIVTAEAVPGHLMAIKEHLADLDGGLRLQSCAMALEHLVRRRTSLVSNEAVDLARIARTALMGVEKFSASRSYEMLLKKRGERHGWRIVRDDLFLKAVVRILCFIGREETDFWNEVLNTCEELPANEKETLRVELARKDGCTDSPAYVLFGISLFMAAACSNEAIGVSPAVRLLARILEDAARQYDRLISASKRMVKLDFHDLGLWAKSWAPQGMPFEDTPFTLSEGRDSTVCIFIAGAGAA